MTILFLFILNPFVLSETLISLSVMEGYSSNVFNDSLEISDSYTILSSDLLLYPTDMVELNLYGDLSLYSEIDGLSNFLGGASLTFIPTDETMKSQLFFNSSLSFVNYGDAFNSYNNVVVSGSGSWNYQLSQSLTSRIGVGASSVSYTKTSSVKDNLLYIYTGLNSTFLRDNTLDIETAYYSKNFKTDDSFDSDNSYLDLSIRYSRPIGSSIGFQVYYLKRMLENEDDTYMDGFTIDYLSPWSSLWGGDDIGISLKKILPKQFVMTLRSAYSEKSYIDQRESDLSNIPVYSFFSRDDISKSISVQIEKKYYTKKSLIVPRLSASFINNESSIDLYTYDKLTFNGSVSFNF